MADVAVQIIGRMDPAANAVLASLGGRYRVLSELGRGGFGHVLLAEDELLRRKVAIKILRKARRDSPAGGFAADTAFLTEARMVARMEHAGIVPIYDVVELDGGGYCIISRYVEGRTLREHLSERRLTPMEAVVVAVGLCEALSHAHKLGIVHRDVKPANIMLTSDMRPLLLDFGLARSWSDIAGEGLAAGTPGYMSPEQARGEDHLINNRSDIFSLGAVFYEMLTGQQSFPCGSARQQLDLLESGAPPPPRQTEPRVPKELERICMKALQPQIRMRYAMAADMLEELQLWKAAMSETLIDTPAPAGAGAGKPPSPAAPASGQHSSIPRVVPRGLRAFDQGDADFFLKLVPGPRDRHGLPESLRFWKQRIESDDPMTAFRVGVLYGPSGCGKSSLIRAGLLPRCAEHVTILFHEARSAGNANRLARALWQKFPSLAPFGDSPPTLLQKLRHNRLLQGGRKLLIVIDQAEQWLRAGETPAVSPEVPDSHGETIASSSAMDLPDQEESSALLNALRQCDGTQVQVLILVRDDFWRSVSRLLAEADVELDGSNSALVDLFEPRHAEMVLESFGRAYGGLPEDPAVPLSKTAREFIRESVHSLEEDRRISPVRLALFAQMFRDREWTSNGLRSVGGVGGVAVTFLEECFRGPTARAQHRMHEGAVRQVLQLFVPETGDVRGPARQQSELLEASGYESRPKAFHELLHILDADLRLLTPVDTLETTDGQASWQLTHDHMVSALREWLLARKADKLRGRAEIRLNERAREWDARPDPARLPGVWEWFRLRLLTRRGRWSALERRWMREGMRRARVVAVVCLFVLGTATVVLSELRGIEHGAAVTRQVLAATPEEVHGIMNGSSAWLKWAIPNLARAAKNPVETPAGLNARLALVGSDASHVEALASALLAVEAPAFGAICEALAGCEVIPVEIFRAVLADNGATHGRKLRAYAALAAFDKNDTEIEASSTEAAQWLLSSVEDSAAWAVYLRPVSGLISPHVEKVFTLAEGGVRERQAAKSLASLHAGDGPELCRILRLVSFEDVPLFVSELQRVRNPVELLAKLETSRVIRRAKAAARALTKEEEAAYRGDANLLLASLSSGDGRHVWPCLKRDADRTLRTFLFLNAATAGVPLEKVLNRLLTESDAGICQALLMALCGYPHSGLSISRQQEVATWMRHTYMTHPDGGVHSSIATLLRRWALHHELQALDQSLPRPTSPKPDTGWWLTPSGVDMRIIVLGDGSLVAISATEAAKPSHQTMPDRIPGFAWQSTGMPITGISWSDAAKYCHDLTEREGLDATQQCYIEEGGLYRPHPDASGRSGYRMAARNEWHAAAFSQAGTRWDFGNAISQASAFVWYASSSNGTFHPVASLLPNEHGLWDSLGNAAEWSHECTRDERSSTAFLFGGSLATLPPELTLVDFHSAGPSTLHPEAGIRVVRAIDPRK